MRLCFYCNYKLDETADIFRSSACPSCGKDLKVCKNCEFYHPGSHWDCQETIEEPVQDKDRANYCPYFSFKDSKPGEVISYKAKKEARKKFNKLFSDEN
jgi:hypothetical protein